MPSDQYINYATALGMADAALDAISDMLALVILHPAMTAGLRKELEDVTEYVNSVSGRISALIGRHKPEVPQTVVIDKPLPYCAVCGSTPSYSTRTWNG